MKLHLKAPQPLIYLSGVGSSNAREKDLYKNGCRYRCYSYAYTCPGAFYYANKMREALETSLKQGVGVMMDSSAHSFHQLASAGRKKLRGKWNVSDIDKLKTIVINQYTKYVKDEGDKWDFYVNFDYVRDCPTIYKMQKLLEKKGIRPMPVYHGDQSLDWLERYCKEGYKLIGISTSMGKRGTYKKRRIYFDFVFNMLEKYGVLAHGFAQTSLSMLFQYPWYSVDSATWAKAAAYGAMLHVDLNRQTVGELHISERVQPQRTSYNDLPKNLQRDIRHEVEDNGFDFQTIRTDGAARSLYNVYVTTHKVMQMKEIVMSTRKKWGNLLI